METHRRAHLAGSSVLIPADNGPGGKKRAGKTRRARGKNRSAPRRAHASGEKQTRRKDLSARPEIKRGRDAASTTALGRRISRWSRKGAAASIAPRRLRCAAHGESARATARPLKNALPADGGPRSKENSGISRG